MTKLISFLTSFLFSVVVYADYGMPVQGNKHAAQVDSLYGFLLLASLISCILVIGGMIFFALKYKRKSENDETPYISHNNTLEFLWSFIPFVIFMVVFGWGWKLYYQAQTAPQNAFEVHVFGRQWGWDFQYKSGRTSSNTGDGLVVPVGKPIKLIMTSNDVLHSFFIPAFRIKQDVVPGMYSSLWFEADKEGEYQLFCTEYCGKDHSRMGGKVKVVSQAEFENWLKADPLKAYEGLNLAERGLKVMKTKGCAACHYLEENKPGLIGPSIVGQFGQKRSFTDGTSGVVGAAYIRQSIKEPAAKKQVGYENGVMSLIPVSEQEITWIIEYMKSTSNK